jgi:hypothetical protein
MFKPNHFVSKEDREDRMKSLPVFEFQVGAPNQTAVSKEPHCSPVYEGYAGVGGGCWKVNEK